MQIEQRIYFFGSVIFMDLFFGSNFACMVFIFWGVTKNAWAEPPMSSWHVIYIFEYTPWDFSDQIVSQKYVQQQGIQSVLSKKQQEFKTTFIKCSSGEFKCGQKCTYNRNVPT